MNPEINFYQTDEAIGKSVAPLLLKVLSEKKKALIFSRNQVQLKEIDSALWNYGRNKFIPHALIFDRDFDPKRQPVLLTDKEENSNLADYLVFLDEPSQPFVSNFSRVFYFFEEGKNLSKIKPTNFYKKSDGKWVKS
ncbi:MAG: DNA polymerase III subunit chi [Alphaproteobacteria bacterium]|nr:DNA polymerase III subunit chi [Alphaproteobacteria bacterium]